MVFWRVVVLCVLTSVVVAGSEKNVEIDWEQARKDHWAFSAPKKVSIPQSEEYLVNPIDAFIKRKLDSAGISPSPLADKRTLVRRIYQSLTGLEPTFEEVQSFLNDQSPKAYEKLIDKLLQSPRYGEKWGRYWLDVARYADGKGFAQPGQSTLYPYSWTYRDYVIRSFNEDRPFNEFVKQQLAADLMELKDKRDLAALGFIRIGQDYRDMKERPHEMVDVATQSFLALTVSCSRCHDHKFDPIPTADYYSLFGVFKSIQEPGMDEFPVIYESSDPIQKKAFEEQFSKHNNAMNDFKKMAAKKMLGLIYKSLPDYMKQVSYNQLKMRPEIRPNRGMLGVLAQYLRNGNTVSKSPFLKLWNQVIRDPKNTEKFVKAALANKETPKLLHDNLSQMKAYKRNDVLKLYIGLLEELKKNKAKKIPELMKGFSDYFTAEVMREKNLLKNF